MEFEIRFTAWVWIQQEDYEGIYESKKERDENEEDMQHKEVLKPCRIDRYVRVF